MSGEATLIILFILMSLMAIAFLIYYIWQLD